MQTIVDRLLIIEQQAKDRLEEARMYRERSTEETQQEKQRIHKQLEEKAAGHIRQVQQLCHEEAETQIAEIRRRYDRLSQRMEAHYTENRDRWLDQLVRRAVDGSEQ